MSAGAAETVMKLLDSAVANAEHNDNMPEEELFVARAFADEGPTAEALAAPCPRSRYPHPQAHQPHHRSWSPATRTTSSSVAASARLPTPRSRRASRRRRVGRQPASGRA